MASCCPPGSAPYLAADHDDEGVTGEADGVAYYQVGFGEVGLLLLPDVWGWNGGRTRAIADEFAHKGLSVWVPKVLTPYEGGTDGDGLAPDFNIAERMGEVGPLFGGDWHADKTGPMALKVVKAMKGAGVKQIGILGFCYGAWLGMKVAGEADIVCAASAHPSVHLAGMVGGDPVELTKKSKCPWAFFPCGTVGNEGADPDIYDAPDGPLFKALEAKFAGKNISKRYTTMAHGFVPRGAIKPSSGLQLFGTGDAVKAAVQDCVEQVFDFFAKMSLLGPKVKLHYFPAAGRGELCRMIAAAGGVELEDVQDDTIQKIDFGSPGGLPVLEHGKLQMSQSTAMELYLANISPRFQKRTPQQKATDAQFCCIKEDVLAGLAPFLFNPDKKKQAATEVPIVCDKWFPVLEAMVPEEGFINGYNFPTPADLAVLNITQAFMLFGAAYALANYNPFGNGRYPKLKALEGRVAAAPSVKAYLKKSKTFMADPFGMASQAKPCLYYFPAAGRSELIRLIAAGGGVEIDERLPDEAGNKIDYGSPSGVPVLTHAKLKMAQSFAIENYMATIGPNYSALTASQRAVDDMFCKIKEDVLVAYAEVLFPFAVRKDPAAAKPADKVPGINEKWITVLESKLPEKGFVHGLDFPSPADLAVLNIAKAHVPFVALNKLAGFDLSAKYKKFASHADRVAEHPSIKEYLAKSASFSGSLFGL